VLACGLAYVASVLFGRRDGILTSACTGAPPHRLNPT
jgi:hypothetical protein